MCLHLQSRKVHQENMKTECENKCGSASYKFMLAAMLFKQMMEARQTMNTLQIQRTTVGLEYTCV